MKVTFLGSGDPLGMPVALCDCKYCDESIERLRTSILVESDDSKLVFDVTPDIRKQLIRADVNEVDGFFATHSHYDHFGGLPELQTLQEFGQSNVKFYGGEPIRKFKEESYEWVDMNFHQVQNDHVEIGGLDINSFAVEHSRFFPTQGFSIQKNDQKIVYVPDLKRIPEQEIFKQADLLIADGQYLFERQDEGDEDHASGENLVKEIEKVNADKVVLVNISEHFNEMSLKEERKSTDYMIAEDFKTIEL